MRCNITVDFMEMERRHYPPVVNDPAMYENVKNVCETLLGKKNVHETEQPIMTAEDFAFYLQKVPGAMLNLGLQNQSLGAVHSLHSPYFFLPFIHFILHTSSWMKRFFLWELHCMH